MKNKILRFPHDDASVGSFRTKLTFKTWGQKGASNSNGEVMDLGGYEVGVEEPPNDWNEPNVASKYEFVIWLPMPAQLNTGYSGEFSENDDMFHLDRDSIIHNEDKGYLGAGGMASTGLTQLTKEIANIGYKMITPNGSVKMSRASVMNNNMGMMYNGARLRSHTFSWKFSPKSIEEQESVFEIIKAIKLASTPETGTISQKAILPKEAEKMIGEAKARLVISEKAEADIRASGVQGDNLRLGIKAAVDASNNMREDLENLQASLDDTGFFSSDELKHVTNLTIPNTVALSFYKDYRINHNLFNINDSFITSFDVNYTASGNWTAHIDGAPLETQITMTLKEIAPITKSDIIGGN